MIYRGVLLFVNCFVAVTSAPFARVATRGGSSVGVNNNKSYAGYQPVSAVVLGSHCAADAGLEAMMDDVRYSWEERDDGTDVCVEKSGRTDAIGAPGITQKPSIKASLMLHSTTNNRGGNHHGVHDTDRSRLGCEVYVHAQDGSLLDCGASDGQSRTPSNSRQCNNEFMMLQATTVNSGGSCQFNTPWERSKGESEGLLWQMENTDERWGERRSSGPIQHLRADSPYLPLPLIDCNMVGLVYQHVFAILCLGNARIVERSARDPVNRLLLMKTNKGRVSLAPIEYFVTQSTGLHSSNHQLGAYNHNQIKLSSRDGGTDESKSNNEGQHAQRSNVTKSNTGLTRPVIYELQTTKSINGLTCPVVYGAETTKSINGLTCPVVYGPETNQ